MPAALGACSAAPRQADGAPRLRGRGAQTRARPAIRGAGGPARDGATPGARCNSGWPGRPGRPGRLLSAYISHITRRSAPVPSARPRRCIETVARPGRAGPGRVIDAPSLLRVRPVARPHRPPNASSRQRRPQPLSISVQALPPSSSVDSTRRRWPPILSMLQPGGWGRRPPQSSRGDAPPIGAPPRQGGMVLPSRVGRRGAEAGIRRGGALQR